jgi:putative FmdB family regulatory protein
MPTYVYRCDDCGHQFELFQRMSDDPVDTCPECDSKVRRVIHPVGVVFKGSGWYINDSRAKNSTSASSTEEKPESKKSDDSKTSKTPDTPKAEPAKTAAD